MGRKVYIAACGIGLGHIGRMVAVADEFRSRGVESVFSTYGPAHRYISSYGYKSHDSPPLMWEEKEDGSISTRGSMKKIGTLGRTFTTHLRQEEERIRKERPDAIIADSRYSTVFESDKFDIPLFFVSNQIRFLFPKWEQGGGPRMASDIISKMNYYWLRKAKEIFIPDLPLPDSISRENMQVPPEVMKRLSFVGLISRRKPADLPDVQTIRHKYGFGKDLFVYAAVSGPGKSRLPMINALEGALPTFKRKSIIVRGEPGNDSSRWVDDYVNIRGWAEDRFELLKAADVVVSRPGLTTISEIVHFGKPCVLIPTPTQSEQEGNARSMEKLGAARLITQAEVDRSTLKAALEDIVTRAEEFGKSTRRIQEMAAKMNGARRIADRIEEYISK
jgi:UDP-N-acetylglucosamine--N-acetylmuramyl-(pentapeptide) pyrophosphoryl-undecaprenol N-acetylglucosamine transferase